MTSILTFELTVSSTSSVSVPMDYQYYPYNPISNTTATGSKLWYYYLFNYSSTPSSSETISDTVSMTINNISTTPITLYVVVISPGGSGGANPANTSTDYGDAYGGGGGAGGVSMSSFTFTPGTPLYITFGTIAPSNEPSDYLDTSFSYNNNIVSAGVGSYGNSCTTYSSTTPDSNNIGGKGGNGSNTTSLSNPYGSFSGGAGGNGGTGTYENGAKGLSYNGATTGSVGVKSPGYLSITMGDGTTAQVAYGGTEGCSGNMSQVLLYFMNS